jgi:tetratricopeptide (TPR) repeat protein
MPTVKRKKEDLDFEISFYEGILGRDPNLVDVLIPLGDAYTKGGYYEKGLSIDRRLSRLRPNDPVVSYNLACSYSLLGQTARALESLEKAFTLGYRDFAFLMRDPDMEYVRKSAAFAALVEKYRKNKTRSP